MSLLVTPQVCPAAFPNSQSDPVNEKERIDKKEAMDRKIQGDGYKTGNNLFPVVHPQNGDKAAILRSILSPPKAAKPIVLNKQQVCVLEDMRKKDSESGCKSWKQAAKSSGVAFGNLILSCGSRVCGKFMGTQTNAATVENVNLVPLTSNISEGVKSPEYHRYHLLIKDRVGESFLKEDDELSYFLCPLTSQLPEVPVTVMSSSNRNNLHFDFQAIAQWLKDHPGQIYPGFKNIFTLDDLVMDFVCMSSIIQRLVRLNQTCLEQDELGQMTLFFPDVFKARKLIMEYCVCNTDRINRILKYTLTLQPNMELQEENDVNAVITDLFTSQSQQRLTSEQMGWKLRGLQVQLRKKKVPITLPTSFWGLFSTKASFLGFSIQEAEKEGQCLEGDFK